MKLEDFRIKMNELVAENDKMMQAFIIKAEKRLAQDIEDADDDYEMPKTLMCAMLESLSWQWQPLSAPRNFSSKVRKYKHAL